MSKVEYIIDIRTISEANSRGHWTKNLGLHQDQKFLAETQTRHALESLPADHELRAPEAAINILFVRHSRGVMDSDNLPAAIKYIRDGVADALAPGLAPGRADGIGRFSWTYQQRKAKGLSSIHVILSAYHVPQIKTLDNRALFLPTAKS